MSVEKVVIDCDPGNDDAWAIISLLKCEEQMNIKVMAITVTNGNTSVENGCRNVLLVLKTIGRLDVPVYAGAESPLILKPGYKPTFHGGDGFADVYSDKPSLDLVQKKHAVEALKELIEENPGEIVLIAVAPLTNLALLYKLNPRISSKVKSLWIMGGNHYGIGNVSRCAEFNFWDDPEAANIVLTESKCQVYIFPWEPCLEASKATPLKDWRMKVLSSNESNLTNLMDPVEKNIQVYGNFILCDTYLVCCFLFPKLIKGMEKFHVTVELGGNHTRGQMVLDRKKLQESNAFVIQDFDAEMFKKFLMWLCGHENSGFSLSKD